MTQIISNPFGPVVTEPQAPIKEIINNNTQPEITIHDPAAPITEVSVPPWETKASVETIDHNQTIGNVVPTVEVGSETGQPIENTRPTTAEVEDVVAEIKSEGQQDAAIAPTADPVSTTTNMPPVFNNAPVGAPVFMPSQQVVIKQPTQPPIQTTVQPQHDPIPPVGLPTTNTPTAVTTPHPGSNAGFDNYTNDKEAVRYKIFDLYWLRAMDQDSSPLLCISYNIDFDNLRISFAKPNNQDTINDTSVELNNVTKTCTFNVYSEICEEILHLMNQTGGGTVRNLERLFKRSTSWSPPQSGFKWDGQDMHLIAAEKGQTFKFLLKSWQVTAFKHALEFMLKESRNLKISKFS